jgi:NADPH:quinone reductase-like Zn-dependent oxidoreductase
MSEAMRAVSQDAAGAPDVLKVVRKERPQPGPGEILVRVQAAGVNPTDWKTRERGLFASGVKPPFTLGFDVAGVVEATGGGVTIFQVGDEVFGMPRFPHPAGAYAEYVAAPARHFAPRPRGLTPVEAGGLPLASLTAWQALVDTADIQPGQRVLIHAAAGGSATWPCRSPRRAAPTSSVPPAPPSTTCCAHSARTN